MDIRELIKKARHSAKNPDEMLLPDCFEEYLDLLELRSQVSKEELIELQPRLIKSLHSLKEVADRVSMSYGMDPAALIELFMGSQNIGMEMKKSIQSFERNMQESLQEAKKPGKLKKNRKLKV